MRLRVAVDALGVVVELAWGTGTGTGTDSLCSLLRVLDFFQNFHRRPKSFFKRLPLPFFFVFSGATSVLTVEAAALTSGSSVIGATTPTSVRLSWLAVLYASKWLVFLSRSPSESLLETLRDTRPPAPSDKALDTLRWIGSEEGKGKGMSSSSSLSVSAAWLLAALQGAR